MNKNYFFLVLFSALLFISCNSNEPSNSQKPDKPDIPERYLVAAQEFCACHGEWLQLQYDGEVAKQNQDIAKMAEISEKLQKLPNRVSCGEAIDKKMEQYEKEDGADLMEQYFDAAAKIHCPIFLEIMDLAAQVEDVG